MKNYNQALEEIEKGYKINPKSKEVEKEKEKILKKLGKQRCLIKILKYDKM